MQKFKVLVLTDHTNHSAENSLYVMLQRMREHPRCAKIDIVTRANAANDFFFQKYTAEGLEVSPVGEDFGFSPEGKSFQQQRRKENLEAYDVAWLRLPPPIPKSFLIFLKHKFPNIIFVNDPDGIYQTGSKAFLSNFADVCAPMKLCRSLDDILNFSAQFPIVLKPLRDYGGKGIIKIENNNVFTGQEKTDLKDFIQKNQEKPIAYLAVKFLKNVTQGDKRIVVVHGKIMGASLRLPPKDAWLCNVAMGGQSVPATVDEDEKKIIARINPLLAKLGIVMYGVDTLVDDNGKRVLSEINTTSIGGILQMEKQQQQPLAKATTDQICKYIVEKINEKNAISN